MLLGSSMAEQGAHNAPVVGSSPTPATTFYAGKTTGESAGSYPAAERFDSVPRVQVHVECRRGPYVTVPAA